jgi:hypothetical protein
MTFPEIFTYGTTSVATIAAVVAAIYGAIAYHRPKGTAVANTKSSRAAPAPPRSLVPIVAAMIAWAAIIAGFVGQRWFLSKGDEEMSLSSENARLELAPQPYWKDSDKSFYMNFTITNVGKSTALRATHIGLAMFVTGNLDPDTIDAYFILLKLKSKKIIGTNSEFPVGPTGQFFSIPDTTPGLQFGSDENWQAAKDGKFPIQVFVLKRYRDSSLPTGKFIYTERCVYLVAPVVHNCEQGYNRSYIAD